ncbi:MAG: serine/threonine protein kinase, partial [Chloroflexi bacterium]|nr:serine/threonine protein kinase [Chloroflexota bacterium]
MRVFSIARSARGSKSPRAAAARALPRWSVSPSRGRRVYPLASVANMSQGYLANSTSVGGRGRTAARRQPPGPRRRPIDYARVMPHVGDILVGRYRIDAPLGSGGSAMVYRAHDLRLQRDVALKILLPNLAQDQAVAHRFEREARSLAAVNHPGIVAVYDVEPADRRTDREPFFVMELCERGSLADLLAARGGRLSPDEIVPAIVDVAGGLASLHGRGFVHRDVKPHNILLTGGGAKLGDFGIARGDDTQGGLTGTGTAMGTLAFLAPEVLAGGPATPAADVFALGVVVYQALTSRLPRPAGTVMEFVQAQAEPVEAASAVVFGLGPFFDAPIAAALAGDPAARPSPIQLAGALKAALADWRRAGRRPDPIAVPGPVAGTGDEPPSAASGRTSGSRP